MEDRQTFYCSVIRIILNSHSTNLTCLVLRGVILLHNKKVLLRERKRQTNRGVSSTPPKVRYPPARSDGVGGIPKVGYPRQFYPPLARSNRGVPKVGYPTSSGTHRPGLMGYPRWGTLWQGYPPVEVPLARSDWGLPEVGYPLVPPSGQV